MASNHDINDILRKGVRHETDADYTCQLDMPFWKTERRRVRAARGVIHCVTTMAKKNPAWQECSNALRFAYVHS